MYYVCHDWQVKAAVLDPEYDFNVERTLTKDDVQKLIQVCISLIPKLVASLGTRLGVIY